MLVPVAFSLPLVIQAADEFQLRGTAETRVGEKLEGWIRFERDTMILKEINGGAERKVSAGQLKSAHLHLAGAVAQRIDRDGDLVTRFHGRWRPASADLLRDGGQFDRPLLVFVGALALDH